MREEVVVGVTSVGSGVGQSVVDSLLLSQLPTHIIGFDANPLSFAAADCADFVHLPPVKQDDYLETLLRACLDRRVRVLIPGLDLELPILARASKRFSDAGVRVLVGGRAYVDLCRDKLAWSRELGLITPSIVRSFGMAEALSASEQGLLRFPAIAKPAGGSASNDVRVLLAPEDLRCVPQGHIVQPMLIPEASDGEREPLIVELNNYRLKQVSEISYQLAVDDAGEVLGHMATRHRLKAGVPVEIVPIDPSPWREAVAPLLPRLRELGMSGPVNFQGRMTDEGPRFFEMNARFTGVTGVRAQLGFNEVDLLIRSALGLPMHKSLTQYGLRRIGLRQVKNRVINFTQNESVCQTVAAVAGWGKKPPLTVMLTGATGWLGSHFLEALQHCSSVGEIICVVRRPEQFSMEPEKARKITILSLDDSVSYGFGLGRVDALFHLASGRPPQGAQSIAESFLFTRRLFDEAGRFQLPALINISSQAVYGKAPCPWRETDPPCPETVYAMAKLASEELIQSFLRASPGSRATSLRLARLYGAAAGLRWEEVPHRFARQARCREEIVIEGGDQSYDLLHLKDAVAALLRLLHADKPWRPVYNLGGGSSVPIMEIANNAVAAARALGIPCPEYRLIPDRQATGQRMTGMDVSQFSNDFCWRPAMSLRASMNELIDLAYQTL